MSVATGLRGNKVLLHSGIMVVGKKTKQKQRAPKRRYDATTPTGSISPFDDHRLVANAGLRLAVIPTQRLGLRKLVDNQVDFGDAPERANTGDNMLTLVASALAGGNCIDDAECRAPAALSHSSSSQNSAVTAATMVLIA